MKVFITGGTGFVGSEVTRVIKESGAAVTLLERKKEKVSKLKDAGFEVFEGSLEDRDLLNSFLASEKFDAIINLIGIIKSVPGFSFQKVHVEYPGILLELAKNSGIERFIHMSALGASDGISEYFSSKFEGQKLVENSGLKWTIFKPSLIFGDNAGFFDDLINLVKSRALIPVIGTGETKFAPIGVSSVASAFNSALHNDETIGKIFELCGSRIYSFEDIIDLIMEIMPPKKIKIHTPSLVAEKTLTFFEKLSLGKKMPITSDQVRMLRYDNICSKDMKEYDELLGLHRTDFKNWLEEYLKK